MSNRILQRWYEVIKNHKVYAHIYNFNVEGPVIFPTPSSFEFQCGFGTLSAEKKISPHVHLPMSRSLLNTSEFIYIKRGTMDVTFLDEDGTPFESHSLTDGYGFLQLKGGHSISFGKDCQYFEIKQGPYHGQNSDKKIV